MAKSSALLVAAVLLGLGGPGVASADPIPGLPDFPEIDESFAVDYGLEHQREICSIIEYRFRDGDPVVHPIDSIINEIAARGGFNFETAGFVTGVALASSCRQFIPAFEAALGPLGL